MSRTQIVILVAGIALSILILEMVRRRQLREEYSWLWLLTAIGYFILAVWPELADRVAMFMGSANPVSAFTFLGLFFLFMLCVQFSVQISHLTEQNKNLAQQIAILDGEIRTRPQDQNNESDVKAHESRPNKTQRPDC